jgi:hypothetical protein
MPNYVGYPVQAMMPEAFPQVACGSVLGTNLLLDKTFSRKRRDIEQRLTFWVDRWL